MIEVTMSVLDTAAEAEDAENEIASRNFEGLAARLAKGDDDPTLEEVTVVLKAADKTTNDLASRTKYHKDRNQDREAIRVAGQAQVERAELQTRLEEAKKALIAAEEAHRRTVRPITSRLEELQALSMEAANARRRLQESCDDPAIRERLSIINARLKSIEPKIREARGRAQSLAGMLAVEKIKPSRLAAHKWSKSGEGQVITKLEGRLDKATAERDKLVAEQQQLVNQSNELHEAMIGL
jgi:hypothetical protein